MVLKVAMIVAALLVFYSQDLNEIFSDALQNEATSHILVIPLLLAYLIYRKRRILRAVASYKTSNQPKSAGRLVVLSGILLCTTAIMLYWYGSYTFTPLEYHILTLPIFTAGLTLAIFNWQTFRHAAFPIAFLIFLTPPPSRILYWLGSTLSVISVEASNAILNGLGIKSVLSGDYGNPAIIISRPNGTTMTFMVDIACSGIYSLIGFLIFAAFIAYIARDKPWKKAVIFLIGLPLVYLLNIIRITIISTIGYYSGEQLALEVFHLLGGWVLIFTGTLVLLAVTERVFKTRILTKRQSTEICNKCNPNSLAQEDFCSYCGRVLKYPQIKLRKSDVAKIATIIIAMIVLIAMQTPVFPLAKGPAPFVIQTPNGEEGNTQILPQVPGYTLSFIYRDEYFEQIAKQDYSLVYAYNKSEEIVWVGFEVVPTRSYVHLWEECLIMWPETHGYQPKVAQLDLRDIQIMQNPPVIARYFAFQYTNTNQTQVVLYWVETSEFMVNNTTERKHVKISLITYPPTSQNITEVENQLQPFATAIANHWEPIKTWTQIALMMSKNGLTLTAAAVALLVAAVIFNTIEKIKAKKANTNFYNKLSTTSKVTIDAVAQAEKKYVPTLENITKTYQTLNLETTTKERLLQELVGFEKAGLVSNQIANKQDEPIQIWKSNL
jgi:exosortase